MLRNTRWSFQARGRIHTFPAVADVNGDGLLEVVFGSDDQHIYALRGSDGVVAWSFETDGPVRSSPVACDINGDGVMEVVAGSDDSNVYALNGVDGRVVWETRCEGPVRSAPAIADIDCDGLLEIVVTGQDSSVYAMDGRTGELIWQSSHRGSRSRALVQSAPCLVDLDGDGKMEIVTGSASGHILIFNPDGSLRLKRDFEAPSFNASVAAGDANGDGRIEIVACSDNGCVYMVGSDGGGLWSRVVGTAIRSPPALADVDGDGRMEILVYVSQEIGTDGKLACLDAEGNIMWEKVVKGQGFWSPIPTDVDHDGGLEVVAFSKGDEVSIFGPGGEVEKSVGTQGNVGVGSAIADVDVNGEAEFIYASNDDRIVCVGSHYGSRQGQIMNSGMRSDLRNTGVYRTMIQAIDALRREAQELREAGGDPTEALQKLLKAEREQGMRDIAQDLEEVRSALLMGRFRANLERRRGERLASLKSKLKSFSSLDVDGASQLALSVSKIERLLAKNQDVEEELSRAEEMAQGLEEKAREKVQALNAKRLNFLVGQFLERFPNPTESDVEEFIQYLNSQKLPFLPYEIRKAIERRKQEAKFRSLCDSGRFDFMSEEEKAIAIGVGLAESIVHEIKDSMGVPVEKIQQRMDEVAADYASVPRLVVADEGKILTDELRKRLRDIPPQKVIPAAVSLFCLYITKLFDFYQELTDFETAYSKFKTNMDLLTQSFGAEDIVTQFQEKACHGIFAEEVRVKRILDL